MKSGEVVFQRGGPGLFMGFLERQLHFFPVGDVGSNFEADQSAIDPGNCLIPALIPAVVQPVLEFPDVGWRRSAFGINQQVVGAEIAGAGVVLQNFPALSAVYRTPDSSAVGVHVEELIGFEIRDVNQCVQIVEHGPETFGRSSLRNASTFRRGRNIEGRDAGIHVLLFWSLFGKQYSRAFRVAK